MCVCNSLYFFLCFVVVILCVFVSVCASSCVSVVVTGNNNVRQVICCNIKFAGCVSDDNHQFLAGFLSPACETGH